MNNMWILSQAPGNGSPSAVLSEPVNSGGSTVAKVASDSNNVPKKPTARGFDPTQLLLLVLMFVVFYFILFRSPRKKQQQHKKMVQSLQKNDRVRTIGGIIGTVVDIKDDEITLKVDESNNTKIKVLSSAIGKNLSKDNK